jgi:hypothetical protein
MNSGILKYPLLGNAAALWYMCCMQAQAGVPRGAFVSFCTGIIFAVAGCLFYWRAVANMKQFNFGPDYSGLYAGLAGLSAVAGLLSFTVGFLWKIISCL